MKLLKYLIIGLSFINVVNAAYNPLLKLNFFKEKETICQIKQNFLYLSKVEKAQIKKNYDLEMGSVVKRINMDCANNKSSVFILSNRVRTEYQTMLVWVSNNIIKKVETLRFDEPSRFKAPAAWLKQFVGVGIKDISKIDGITGATLTALSIKKLAKQGIVLETK